MNSTLKHMNFLWLSGCFSSKKCFVEHIKDIVKYSSMASTQCIPDESEKQEIHRKGDTRYAGRKYRRQWEDKKQDIEHATQKKLCEEPFERVKKKKVAMLLGYSGADYYGMQRNPNVNTIEEDLCKALFRIKYINTEAFAQMQTIQFQRAARTDKGVSAARQVVSLKLVEHATVEDINKELPQCIRVFDIKRVTKGFNSKRNCDARTYSYTIPTYAFEPTCLDEVSRKAYRLTEEKRNLVNEVLAQFKGTKNFHNFTAKKDSEDPSTLRYMYSFQIEDVFVTSELEFAVLTIKGQSFMLHQIRKMVGMSLAIIRGLTDMTTIEKVFKKDPIDVPTAPSLGLVLEKVHYDRYNTRYGSDGIHSSLEWSEMNEIVEKFKHEHIYPNIVKTELEEAGIAGWIEEGLNRHKFESRDAIKKSDNDSEIGTDDSKISGNDSESGTDNSKISSNQLHSDNVSEKVVDDSLEYDDNQQNSGNDSLVGKDESHNDEQQKNNQLEVCIGSVNKVDDSLQRVKEKPEDS